MIRQVLRSKVAKNGIWMYLLQFFNTICPLLTIPYIVRVLDSTSYGVFSLALNLVSYFQVLVEYGFGMSATRKVALDDRESEINQIFSNILSARGLLLTACFALSVTLVNIFQVDPTQRKCIFVLLVSLLGYTLQVNWLFQGKQEMKFISVANIVSRLSTLALIFVFVRSSDDLYVYCFLYAIAPVISSSIGIVLAKRKYKLRFVWTGLSAVKNELKEGWYVFTTSLSSKVFGAIGITLLGVYATESVVGIYSAIHKIPNIIVLGWAPISQIIYPVTSKKISTEFTSGYRFVKRVRSIILPVFILVAVLVIVFSRRIVEIALGSEYAQFHYWLWPLMLWILVAINNNFLGIQTLLGSGHDKMYSKCFQISVICTVALNYILIKSFQGWGAALAPLMSECILYGLLLKSIHAIENPKLI